jgi:hypothetical protein
MLCLCRTPEDCSWVLLRSVKARYARACADSRVASGSSAVGDAKALHGPAAHTLPPSGLNRPITARYDAMLWRSPGGSSMLFIAPYVSERKANSEWPSGLLRNRPRLHPFPYAVTERKSHAPCQVHAEVCLSPMCFRHPGRQRVAATVSIRSRGSDEWARQANNAADERVAEER